MDYYQNSKMKCSDKNAVVISFLKRERIFELIAGFEAKLSHINIQVLTKETLPSLNENF